MAETSHTPAEPKMDCNIEKEIEELKSQFLSAVNEAAKALKTIELSEVKRCITQLSASIKYQRMRYFAGNLTAINRAQSVDDIFSILELYWDFLNCGLLSEIVHKLGNGETKELMENYTEKLRVFQRKTNLRDFSRWTRETPPHFTEIVTELGDTWGDRTLEDLERLRKELAHLIHVEEYALHFKSAQPNCASVTWVLLNFLPSITDALQSIFPLLEEKYDIVKMIFRGKDIPDLELQQKGIPVKLKFLGRMGGALVVNGNKLDIVPSIGYKNWNIRPQGAEVTFSSQGTGPFSSQNYYLVGNPEAYTVGITSTPKQRPEVCNLWRRQNYANILPEKSQEQYETSSSLQLWVDEYAYPPDSPLSLYFIIKVDDSHISYELGSPSDAKINGAGAFILDAEN